MSARAPTDRLLAQVAHLVRAALQRVVEGLRYAVHVPLHPPLHGVLDLASVVLHPEAFALLKDNADKGETCGGLRVMLACSHTTHGDVKVNFHPDI